MSEYIEDLPLWADDEAKKILLGLAEKYEVPIDVIEELVRLQKEKLGSGRAKGIYDSFDEVLSRVK